jgi:hypothetical protein
MTKNILLSLMASSALVVAFALPVNAATAQLATTAHHTAIGQHAAAGKHYGTEHLIGTEHHAGHLIKTELEANKAHLAANKPAASKVLYRVKAAKLNERTGPGTNHHRVGSLKEGTLVEVKELSHDGKWALVHTGTWVSTKYLEKDSEKHTGMTHLGEKTAEYHAYHAKKAAEGHGISHVAGQTATHAAAQAIGR